MKKQYLQKFIMIVFFVVICSYLAIHFNLYFIFPWFDVFMHLFGGLAIGYMSLFLFFRQDYHTKLRSTGFFALSIGVAWEVFERVGYIFIPHIIQYGNIFDTIEDIIYAILAALFIIVIEKTHD